MFADPVFDALDPRLGSARRSTGQRKSGAVERRLGRLAFGGEAAERVFRLVPPEQGLKVTGLDATRARALGPDLANYRVVHFDTHGFQDDRHPELAGIAFSMVDRAGADLDGFVRLHDVYAMRLAADLVVLSACETGLGVQRGAEGVASLARGFFSAGARKVLSTLWAIDDEASAALMERFYAGLLGSERLSPEAALRAAQRAIRNEARWRDPYYWAGFVLQGD
jgi:CHAT domain-containing protein